MTTVGIGTIVIGYAVFYWGIHHWIVTDPNLNWKKQSLWCLLGLSKLKLPSFTEFPFGTPSTAGGGAQPAPNPPQPPSLANPATQKNWISDILKGIGAPTTKHNFNKLLAWNLCEGNDKGHSGLPINNPLNVTCDAYQSATCTGTDVNSDHVQAYKTWADGLAATVAKLNEPFASLIKTNLVKDGSSRDFRDALNHRPRWGTDGDCVLSHLVTLGQVG